MKKVRILSNLGMTLMGIFLFISCSNQDESFNTQNIEQIDKKELLKETSILFGRLISNDNVQKEVLLKMKEVDDDTESVSFAYLLGNEKALKKNEVVVYKNSKTFKQSKNLLKSALAEEFYKNEKDYTVINNAIEENINAKVGGITANDIANNLSELLVNQEMQVFYPFGGENFANDDTTVTDYYVSYDPLNAANTNEAFQFSNGSSTYNTIPTMQNDFLDGNPVFLIVPIDNCDIPGRPCDFVDLVPIGDGGSSVPPPLEGDPVVLTYNVNHNLIPEGDIISTRIPYIRINGTSWMGFAGTHQKLSFWRGSPDGVVTSSNGTFVAGAKGFPVKEIRVKRKYIKHGYYWLTFDAEFDPDWNMSENTQAMAVFSIHHLSVEASAELSVKAGLKMDSTGTFKPNAETTISGKIKVKNKHSKFRDKVELSRRQVLSTIIGNGITGQTIHSNGSSYNGPDNNINYNLKKIGIVDYYVKYWYTDLTP